MLTDAQDNKCWCRVVKADAKANGQAQLSCHDIVEKSVKTGLGVDAGLVGGRE